MTKIRTLENGDIQYEQGDTTRVIPNDGLPIDICVGGIPCTSFSVAGKREGLAGKSGLVIDYIRRIYELAAYRGCAWCVYENVPGMLSSSNGNDFAVILSGLAGWQVAVPEGGWGNSGAIANATDGNFGVAWRVLDARYTRVDGFPRAVPQRRRRVFLVGHLGDWRRAAEVLLEPSRMFGNSPPSRKKGKAAPEGLEGRSGNPSDLGFDARGNGDGMTANTLTGDHANRVTDYTPIAVQNADGKEPSSFIQGSFGGMVESNVGGIGYEDELSPTLKSAPSGGNTVPDVLCVHGSQDPITSVEKANAVQTNNGLENCVCFQQNQRNEVRMLGGDGGVAGALNAEIGMKGQNYAAFPLDMDKLKPSNNTEEAFANGERKGGNGFGVGDDNDPSYTLNTTDKHGVAFKGYARRLLPVECERLMGFPDNHTIPAFAPGDITDDLVERFIDVFWTWNKMNAEDPSKVKRKTAKFVRAWLNKIRSPETCPDAPRYKACGNSMCVNCMRWLGLGIVEVERRRQENGK